MPTNEEIAALAAQPYMYVAAGVRGVSVPGYFFGNNPDMCELPKLMSGCLFLPVTEPRADSAHERYFKKSLYLWSNLQFDFLKWSFDSSKYSLTLAFIEYFQKELR